MDTMTCVIPPFELYRETKRLSYSEVIDGSGTARGPGTRDGWINGLRMTRLYGPGYPNWRHEFPIISLACQLLADQRNKNVHQIMVNELAAHKALDTHRDGEPAFERWHYPVTTHKDVTWWDEYNGDVHMDFGMWWGPVPYCNVLHSMRNDSNLPRTHIVLDLE